ncbi:DUF131 domain-containing protein [Thermococcus sp.]|uniref:TIGR00304 family membrane protein n=1 Tax=Thermococcus sp. TaxID=35749 RepID=UPI0025E121D7|nr:DUF131 domain-containing protein [Thermococcus sp.]
MEKGMLLIGLGMGMIVLGFLLVLVGVLLGASSEGSDVEGGGVIMIGPIPIVFGSGRGATLAMILAVLLMVLWIAAFLLARRG